MWPHRGHCGKSLFSWTLTAIYWPYQPGSRSQCVNSWCSPALLADWLKPQFCLSLSLLLQKHVIPSVGFLNLKQPWGIMASLAVRWLPNNPRMSECWCRGHHTLKMLIMSPLGCQCPSQSLVQATFGLSSKRAPRNGLLGEEPPPRE